MHQEKYSLTWHTYSDHLKSMMKELMMNEEFSDVTLVTEDKKQIKANISVLSSCSPIFRDILKKEKNSSTIMYLRGVQYAEIESILQFIYLGEASFYEERMDEFLAVAKSLEIKELCNAETENDEPGDEPSTTEPETFNENLKEQTIMSEQFTKQPLQEGRREVVGVNGKYECEPCQKSFTGRSGFNQHKQSIHQGVQYARDQCDYQATKQSHLNVHIQSKHEGVKYACDQCENQFTERSNLVRHIQSKHEGIKYSCDQCDNQFTQQGNLRIHIQSKHEGIRYHCDQCDYQSTQKGQLKMHKKDQHKLLS